VKWIILVRYWAVDHQMRGLQIHIRAFMLKNYFHHGSVYEMGDNLTKFIRGKGKALPIQVWRGP
jgi:hypothetical protein